MGIMSATQLERLALEEISSVPGGTEQLCKKEKVEAHGPNLC